MITIAHPYASAVGITPLGLPADGSTFCGRLADFDAVEAERGVFSLSWTPDRYSPGALHYLFQDGAFARTVGGVETTVTVSDNDRQSLDLMILPPDGAYEQAWMIETADFRNRVRLGYTIPGEAITARIFKNQPGVPEIDTTSPVGGPFIRSRLSVTGTTNAAVAGSWPSQVEPYAVITITIDSPGVTGVATYRWAWGTLTGESRATGATFAPIGLNGVRLKFSEGASWTYNQSFTIRVQLTETWTSRRLPNGYHAFQVATGNRLGQRLYSSEASITLAAAPDAPEAVESLNDYTEGTGVGTFGWRIPADPNAVELVVQRNYPADGLDACNENIVVHREAVSPGQLVTVQVTGLQPGLNRIWGRITGEKNLLTGLHELELDADLNSVAMPNAPASVSGRVESDGTVTLTIVADDTSDEVKVYTDGGTGAVNYSLAIATAANPGTSAANRIRVTGLYPADGTYLFGVRASWNGSEEENTDTVTLLVDRTLPAVAQSLTLEAVR